MTCTRGFNFQHSYQQLPQDLWAEVYPEPVAAPQLLLYNSSLAHELGLPDMDARQAAQYFSGNQLLPGSHPLAQAYAGHQFGYPTMLGDGRAVLLGEQITPAGKRFDIQLKGAGRTPFSRGGDGRAALGPMLREYLVSEALTALGIPSTRGLAVVTTGESVQREQPLPGAILTRVASSHIRIGSFQYAAWHSNKDLLPALLEYTIARHDPELSDAEQPALALLEAVMDRQIALVVHWLRVGFIHGVMNTDNMALSGETIDYGPCAFMDEYDPATVFSSIDRRGRYAYYNQPGIVQWNLERLAESLLPMIDTNTEQAVAQAEAVLAHFAPRLADRRLQMMKAKLGLTGEAPEDQSLIDEWLALLHAQRMDYTNAHRALMQPQLPASAPYHTERFQHWHQNWRQRFEAGGTRAREQMRDSNPVIIPRNHLVNRALEQAEAGDMNAFHALHQALTTPYQEGDPNDFFRQPPSEEERVLHTFCGT